LSGDHIVEQHVHNIDVANWVLGAHPVRATAVGGRQRRTGGEYGHIYDHFAVDFEYESGARVLSMCRQVPGSANHVGESFTGTAGRSNAAGIIEGARAWTRPRAAQEVSPYLQEHVDLIASIRAGSPLNELKQVAESTLTAIMGREAAYTGQAVTWNEMLEADHNLAPPTIAFGELAMPPVPMPGVTKLERGWEVAGTCIAEASCTQPLLRACPSRQAQPARHHKRSTRGTLRRAICQAFQQTAWQLRALPPPHAPGSAWRMRRTSGCSGNTRARTSWHSWSSWHPRASPPWKTTECVTGASPTRNALPAQWPGWACAWAFSLRTRFPGRRRRSPLPMPVQGRSSSPRYVLRWMSRAG